MFYAINSKTGEKVNSLTIESNPSYQFIDEEIWYADPDEIENCPKEIDINKIEVIFRQGAMDVINYNGTKYDISPCFYIPNKYKLGINTIPESKEHKLAKNWIYNKLKHKDLLLSYSSINKPFKYENTINLSDLILDLSKVGIEVNSSTSLNRIYRRADIICPLSKKHELFGNGIVFEIQFTKQKERTRILRELDWAIRGYSIAWLHESDFDNITEEIIALKNPIVKVETFANLIKQNRKEHIKDMKFTVEELCRQLDYKKEDIINKINDRLYEVTEKIRNERINNINYSHEDLKELVKLEFEYIKSSVQPRCPNCNSLLKIVFCKSLNRNKWCCPKSCKDGWMEII